MANRGSRTRAQIVDAGARLFSLHGYAATGLGELLGTLGLSKGAFYHHFRSKNDLLLAVLALLRQGYERELLGPINNGGGGEEPVQALLGRLVELNESGQWLNCRLLARLAQETAHRPDPVAQQVADLLEWWLGACASLIVRGQTAGSVRTDMPAGQLARLLVYAWLGAVSCRHLDGELSPLSRFAAQIEAGLASPQ